MHKHGGNLREAAEKYHLREKDIIDFSANINPAGPPPGIRNIIPDILSKIIHYPDPESKKLKKTLVKTLNLRNENILIGNGSTELIYLITSALKPERVLIPLPCFSEYENASKLTGAKITFLRTSEDKMFEPDADKLSDLLPGTDMLFISNPCNPTGAILTGKKLLFILKKCGENKVNLVLDEAFINFTENPGKLSLLNEVNKFSNLLIIRSLTKIFALPGLRIGYLAGSKKLIKKIANFQYPWSVNLFAQKAAVESIKDTRYMKSSRDYIFKEREYLYKRLGKIKGIKTFKPGANFIFCKLTGKKYTSPQLTELSGKKGILIRDCSNFRGLNNKYFRVAVKKRTENRKLVKVLEDIFLK